MSTKDTEYGDGTNLNVNHIAGLEHLGRALRRAKPRTVTRLKLSAFYPHAIPMQRNNLDLVWRCDLCFAAACQRDRQGCTWCKISAQAGRVYFPLSICCNASSAASRTSWFLLAFSFFKVGIVSFASDP